MTILELKKNHLEKRWFVDSMEGRFQVWTNLATKSATSRTWVICKRWSRSTGLFQRCTQRILISRTWKVLNERKFDNCVAKQFNYFWPSYQKMPFELNSKPLIFEHYSPDCLITWRPCCISLKNIWSKCIALGAVSWGNIARIAIAVQVTINCKSHLLNVMFQVSQVVSFSQLCH